MRGGRARGGGRGRERRRRLSDGMMTKDLALLETDSKTVITMMNSPKAVSTLEEAEKEEEEEELSSPHHSFSHCLHCSHCPSPKRFLPSTFSLFPFS